MATHASLTSLPTEILEAIFLRLDAPSVVAASATCKLIKKTADAPVIWRHLCLTRFTCWAPHRNITAKTFAPLSSVDWRGLFIDRIRIEKETRRLLNETLGTQHRRIQHINEVAAFGYDAKETLLEECACPDDAEDVLARRYYANAMLERIQREVAIQVWEDLGNGRPVPLEIALGAYDMFARSGADVDLDIFTEDLDDLAKRLQEQYPDFSEMSTRWKASTLAIFLRDQGFCGVNEHSYRLLSNSYIGLALRSEGHQSLPLISVAIYCCLARRIGLDARPCGFLFHVYCLVYAPKDYTLDGQYKPTSSEDLDFMYLDPFHSPDEVAQTSLLSTLREMGVPSSEHAGFLSHTTTREMALRTGRNIMNSVQRVRGGNAHGAAFRPTWFDTYPDIDNSFYSAIWAFIMLSPREDDGLPTGGLHTVSTRRRQYLPYLLEHFQTHFPWDVALLTKYIIPLFDGQPEGIRLEAFVRSMRMIDSTQRPAQRRSPGTTDKVSFKIGQLFKHERYGYEGVITGWDPSCDAGEDWIQEMGVDRLPKGRNQSFYHVL
jgi:F-box protein 21